MHEAGRCLDRARCDVAYFARCCGWPMTEVQVAAIVLDTLVTAILAPRQSGKSHALALLVAWWAVSRRDQFVLIVSGGDTAAVRLMDPVRRLVRSSPLLQDSIVKEATRRLELSNGSVIESVPTSEFQIRSATTDLLVFDEGGLIPASDNRRSRSPTARGEQRVGPGGPLARARSAPRWTRSKRRSAALDAVPVAALLPRGGRSRSCSPRPEAAGDCATPAAPRLRETFAPSGRS